LMFRRRYADGLNPIGGSASERNASNPSDGKDSPFETVYPTHAWQSEFSPR